MKKRIPCKKFLTVGLCLTLVGIMTACSGNNTAAKSGDNQARTQTQSPKTERPTSMTEENLSAATTTPVEDAGIGTSEASTTEESSIIDTGQDTIANYMVDGIFDLEGYMSKFQFGEINEDNSATEVIYYFNNRDPHVFATLTISSYKNNPGTTSFFIEDNAAGIFYMSKFIEPSDDIVTTNIDGIILNQKSLQILCTIVDEYKIRLAEGNYPFDGLDIDSSHIDMNN
ncbi:MAG: hypothetical protein Q4E46_00200 [Candidatus Saccharibacteria bacterium]|nr:hypothetical protein [Candidatus Saccharibacteria bacterium]